MTTGCDTAEDVEQIAALIPDDLVSWLSSSGDALYRRYQQARREQYPLDQEDVPGWRGLLGCDGKFDRANDLHLVITGLVRPPGYVNPITTPLDLLLKTKLGPVAIDALQSLSTGQWVQFVNLLGCNLSLVSRGLETAFDRVLPVVTAN